MSWRVQQPGVPYVRLEWFFAADDVAADVFARCARPVGIVEEAKSYRSYRLHGSPPRCVPRVEADVLMVSRLHERKMNVRRGGRVRAPKNF